MLFNIIELIDASFFRFDKLTSIGNKKILLKKKKKNHYLIIFFFFF
jgi:hypothetical protein